MAEADTFAALTGQDVQEAVIKLWAEGARDEIQTVRDGDFVTCDFRDDRIRVWYNAETNLVTKVIRG